MTTFNWEDGKSFTEGTFSNDVHDEKLVQPSINPTFIVDNVGGENFTERTFNARDEKLVQPGK